MRSRERIVRQILIILRDLGEQKPKLTDIEFVRDENGIITGYRFEIRAEEEKPRLRIVHGSKIPSSS